MQGKGRILGFVNKSLQDSLGLVAHIERVSL